MSLVGLLESGHVVLCHALRILGVLRLGARVDGARFAVRVEGRPGGSTGVARRDAPRRSGANGFDWADLFVPVTAWTLPAKAKPVEVMTKETPSIIDMKRCFMVLSGVVSFYASSQSVGWTPADREWPAT